jgi:hypothetical protein
LLRQGRVIDSDCCDYSNSSWRCRIQRHRVHNTNEFGEGSQTENRCSVLKKLDCVTDHEKPGYLNQIFSFIGVVGVENQTTQNPTPRHLNQPLSEDNALDPRILWAVANEEACCGLSSSESDGLFQRIHSAQRSGVRDSRLPGNAFLPKKFDELC